MKRRGWLLSTIVTFVLGAFVVWLYSLRPREVAAPPPVEPVEPAPVPEPRRPRIPRSVLAVAGAIVVLLLMVGAVIAYNSTTWAIAKWGTLSKEHRTQVREIRDSLAEVEADPVILARLDEVVNGVPNRDAYEAYLNLKVAGDALVREVEELAEDAVERVALEDALRDVRAITSELKH